MTPMNKPDLTDYPLFRAFEYALKLSECFLTDQRVLKLSTPDHFAVIDRDDYERVAQFRWHAHKPANGRVYAKRSVRIGGTVKTVYLHKAILEAPKGMDIDHINGDGLNNSKANLRTATRSQNLANRGRNRNNTSGFKGVYKNGNGWAAKLKVNGHPIYLGTFEIPELAAEAYDKAAREQFGEFAYLNFSEGN